MNPVTLVPHPTRTLSGADVVINGGIGLWSRHAPHGAIITAGAGTMRLWEAAAEDGPSSFVYVETARMPLQHTDLVHVLQEAADEFLLAVRRLWDAEAETVRTPELTAWDRIEAEHNAGGKR